MNILNNSRDALEKNNINEKYIFVQIYKENNNAVISIQDSGGGIKDDIINKIFEPYFTTKHQSQGTGLGLHMTYNFIVDGMKGSLKAKNICFDYENENYNGAEFTITLPLS